MNKIRTRFAPSPTGYLHIGGLRTALFNYLWAKKNKGEFILRIEDTDQQRLVEGAEEKMITTLQKLGLKIDGHILRQSDRLALYQKAAEQLLKSKHAYHCFCSADRLNKLREQQQANKQVPKYDGHCRSLSQDEVKEKIAAGEKHVIRFKIPEQQIIKAQDIVYGKISVKSEDLDDLVIIKSDGFPTYHLANVVDDHDMKISHVIRGEEWLPSLPKHILLYQALKYEPPHFVHLPLLLNPDKSKLSKRQGDVAVEDFLAKGYLPEVLINYVALLGWNPGTEQEIFSIAELIKEFSLEKINKSGSVFDINKLNWFNSEYIRLIVQNKGTSFDNLVKYLEQYIPEHPDRVADLLQLFGSRLNYLSEIKTLSQFLFKLPDYTGDLLIFKKSTLAKTQEGINLALGVLGKIEESHWQQDKINQALQTIGEKHKLSPGDIFWPVRVALSGLEKSPSPVEILEFLGKKESLARINKAIRKLE